MLEKVTLKRKKKSNLQNVVNVISSVFFSLHTCFKNSLSFLFIGWSISTNQSIDSYLFLFLSVVYVIIILIEKWYIFRHGIDVAVLFIRWIDCFNVDYSIFYCWSLNFFYRVWLIVYRWYGMVLYIYRMNIIAFSN